MKLSSGLRAFYLALATLALTTAAALAIGGEPINGVPVGLEHEPGGIVVARGVTDDKGQVNFGNLAPGKYLIVISADALNMAVKKLDPNGLRFTIVVTFGLPGEKPIATSSVPELFPIAASLAVHVVVGDVNGDASKTKPHNYVGVVSLVK